VVLRRLRDALDWIKRQPPLQIVTTVAALLIATAALVAIGLEIGEEEEDAAAVALPNNVGELPTPESDSDQEDELVVPTFVPTSEASIARLVILTAVVDTDQIGTLGLTDGTLTPPPDTQTIVYYDVSALPGDPAGNMILAGSAIRTADEEGVLANLGGVGEGDQILVELEDGTQFTYRVFTVSFRSEGEPALTPSDLGCTDENCAGFGTLALVGFEGPTATVVVQAQVVRG
jgi:hypothetical protein